MVLGLLPEFISMGRVGIRPNCPLGNHSCPLGNYSPQCGCPDITIGGVSVGLYLQHRNIQLSIGQPRFPNWYFLVVPGYWATRFVNPWEGTVGFKNDKNNVTCVRLTCDN